MPQTLWRRFSDRENAINEPTASIASGGLERFAKDLERHLPSIENEKTKPLLPRIYWAFPLRLDCPVKSAAKLGMWEQTHREHRERWS